VCVLTDLSGTIVPKSDQLNADDLIAGPRTIVVTRVAVSPGEQPVSVYFEGDGGKPYKPCKSMCRVLVTQWGPNGDKYIGRAITLYRDPEVTWGGMAVGGIRISHLSDIAGDTKMALTKSRKERSSYTIRKLEQAPTLQASPEADAVVAALKASASAAEVETIAAANRGKRWSRTDGAKIKAAIESVQAMFATGLPAREPGEEG
jgi:hypothetical protein